MVGSIIENERDVNIFIFERTIQQLINVLYMHDFFDLQEIKLLSFVFYVDNFIILHYILAYFSFVLMLASLWWHFSAFHDHVNAKNLLNYFYGTWICKNILLYLKVKGEGVVL
jgi:hypothetical protein